MDKKRKRKNTALPLLLAALTLAGAGLWWGCLLYTSDAADD